MTQYCKLWRDYCEYVDTCTALNQGDNQNDTHETSVANFKTAIMLLLSRYRCSYLNLEANGSTPPHHSFAGALIATFEITTHIFASPLTRHPDAALYYSHHYEDCVFQARFDPYSRPFWGHSLVTPPDNAEAIYKASKWAGLSCYSDIPCLTVMLLPRVSHKSVLSVYPGCSRRFLCLVWCLGFQPIRGNVFQVAGKIQLCVTTTCVPRISSDKEAGCGFRCFVRVFIPLMPTCDFTL